MDHRGYPRPLPCGTCYGGGKILEPTGETITLNCYYRDDSVVGGWVHQEIEQAELVPVKCKDCDGKG